MVYSGELHVLRHLFLFTGVFSAAHDLKMEWVIIKGISDYADGTASLTEHWKPFASVMAAYYCQQHSPGARSIWTVASLPKTWYQSRYSRLCTHIYFKITEPFKAPVSTFKNIPQSWTFENTHLYLKVCMSLVKLNLIIQSHFNSGLE